MSLSGTHPLCPQTKILNEQTSLVPSITIKCAASRSKTNINFFCINMWCYKIAVMYQTNCYVSLQVIFEWFLGQAAFHKNVVITVQY